MSEFMVCKGQFDDVESIKETLGECGVTKVEVHTSPVTIQGYRGHGNSTAEIVVRAGKHNHYDIGFAKRDAVYVPVINDMDSRFGLGKAIVEGEFMQKYCKNRILREVAKRRCRVVENMVTEEGKIRIVLSS